MRPREVDLDDRPYVLVWELTQACDLACKHCRATAEPRRHTEELTTAEGRRLLEDIRGFHPNQLVVLSGGDPLYRSDALELVRHGADLGLTMTMTPSGTSSLTPSVIEALDAAGLRRLSLSLDGPTASAHDRFRQEVGSFEQTVHAARAARDDGMSLQINTTVCAETVEHLPAMADLVDDLGADLWAVFFLVPVGRGAVLDPVGPERAEAVMAWLADVAASAPFGVKTTEAPHFRRVALQRRRDASPGRDDRGEAGRGTGITAGCGFAFVSHVGEVYPSGFLPRSAGNVRDEDVVDVYRESPLFRRLRDRDALEGKCGACEFRHVCGGSRSRAYATTGDPLESDPLCAYVPGGFDGPLPGELAGGDAT